MTETPIPARAGQGTPLNEAITAPSERRLLTSLRTVVPWVLLPLHGSRVALGSIVRRPWRALAVGALLAVIGLGIAVLGINLWAGSHFRSAQSCVEHYRDAEALEHLHACLRVWPRDPDCLLLAARAARRLGDFPEAEDFQDRYQRVRGDDDDLTLEGVLLRAERGDLDAVRDFCQSLEDQDHPGTPLILEAQARGYLRQFRLREAMTCLERWQKRQPNDPQVFFLKGRVFEANLSSGEALANYRRVLQLDPEHDEARRLLANHLLDMAQAPEALPHLRYLLRQHPDQPSLRVLLARCRSQMGQAANAEQILDEVLERYPHYAEALAERGNLALQRGQARAAATYLRQAAAQDPSNYRVHYQLFQALKRTGKGAEARTVQKRLKLMDNDIKRIQQIVTRQMQVRPHDPALHFEVGMIALRAGSVKEGLRWLHSALQENPNYVPAHRALALFYQQTGNPGRAARHRELAEAAASKRPVRSAPKSAGP